jgi:HK97 family phage portal protein
MKLTEAVVTFFRNRSEASIDKRKIWGAGGDPWGTPVHAGVSVSEETAQRVTVVHRCIEILAGTLASMGWGAYRKQGPASIEVDRPGRWLTEPNPETTPFELVERIVESLALTGNAFLLITARDALQYPMEVWPINPRQVTVVTLDSGRTAFDWTGGGSRIQRLSRYGPDRPSGDVLHLKLRTHGGNRGLSPIEDVARQAIGLALVTEKSGARMFGKGMMTPWAVQLPQSEQGGVGRTKEHLDLMRDTFAEQHEGPDRSWRPLFLTGGATLAKIGITPEEAQFLETRRFQVEEIARLYGIPPHMVGAVERTTSWGTGIEQQSLGFHRYTLLSYIVRIEQALSQLLPRGQFVKLNQRTLLRADAKTEAEVASRLLEHAVLNFDDVRGLYEMPPRPGGKRYMLPANMVLLGSDGVAEPKPEPEPQQQELPEPSPNGNGRAREAV